MRSEMKQYVITFACLAFGMIGLNQVVAGCFELKYEEKPIVPIIGEEGGAEGDVVPGEYIIVLKRDMAIKMPAMLQDVTNNGGVIKSDYRPLLPAFAAYLPPAVLNQLVLVDAIDYIEANRIIRPTSVQSCTPSWGLDRIDQRRWPDPEGIQAYSSSDPTQGQGVDVYIFDSGLDMPHVDLNGRVPEGYDVFAPSPSWSTDLPADCNGHGTHVTHIVGGKTYGVAKHVTLFPVKVLKCLSANCKLEGDIIKMGDALKAMAPHLNQTKPSVVLLNFDFNGDSEFADDMMAAIPQPLYVIAAGNHNEDACNQWYSTTYQDAGIEATSIIVGASTIDDTRMSLSNYGTCVDIFAPGDGITSVLPSGSTCHAGTDGVLSGTSQAAAHVAGVAARLWAQNPGTTTVDLRTKLHSTAVPGKIDWSDGSPNRLLFADSAEEGLEIQSCDGGKADCDPMKQVACCEGKTKCNRSILCSHGECEVCGLAGTPCCKNFDMAPGDDCGGDLTCDKNGVCGCGGPGQKCCGGPGGSCALGLACDDNLCGGCGVADKPCCSGTDCVNGFACNGANKCVVCGGANQPCCDGLACQAGSECKLGTCVACGQGNQPCCAGQTCNDGQSCKNGTCEPCGGTGQPCCNGDQCGQWLGCSNGNCTPCGSEGGQCCPGQQCHGDMDCLGGSCRGECTAICREGTYIKDFEPHSTWGSCNNWAQEKCDWIAECYLRPKGPFEYQVSYNGTDIGGDDECGSGGQACCLQKGPFCNGMLGCKKHDGLQAPLVDPNGWPLSCNPDTYDPWEYPLNHGTWVETRRWNCN